MFTISCNNVRIYIDIGNWIAFHVLNIDIWGKTYTSVYCALVITRVVNDGRRTLT